MKSEYHFYCPPKWRRSWTCHLPSLLTFIFVRHSTLEPIFFSFSILLFLDFRFFSFTPPPTSQPRGNIWQLECFGVTPQRIPYARNSRFFTHFFNLFLSFFSFRYSFTNQNRQTYFVLYKKKYLAFHFFCLFCLLPFVYFIYDIWHSKKCYHVTISTKKTIGKSQSHLIRTLIARWD